MQNKLSPGPLLDEQGHLAQAGYATSLLRQYRREDIRASRLRIKEWDYYLIYNRRFGLALTIDDNGYMSLLSASVLDFEKGTERTVSPMGLLPLGRTGLPASSAQGRSHLAIGKSAFTVDCQEGRRHLYGRLAGFEAGRDLEFDLWLEDEPRDSMVIATPFPEKKTAFYYNQKILGMRARGSMRLGATRWRFDPESSLGLLDWGRGVWTYRNTWYWGAGHGMVDGRLLAFNIGYGFGDTSAASENMLFVDGVAHKLEQVRFHIPGTPEGKDDFLAPWRFDSSDGRFEMDFVPILDRASCTSLGVIKSDQHQVFGRFSGSVILDDGRCLRVKDFLGFAEKVYNKW